MKNLINIISVIALFALTMTSCGKDAIETEPTLEERLVGEWILTDINVSASSIAITGDSIHLVTIDNGSTLELNILENNEATLAGVMSTVMTTTTQIPGLEEMIVESDDNYNESRTWTINDDKKFEFVSSEVADFGVATLAGDKLFFVMTEYPELPQSAEEFPIDIDFSDFTSEIIFTRK